MSSMRTPCLLSSLALLIAAAAAAAGIQTGSLRQVVPAALAAGRSGGENIHVFREEFPERGLTVIATGQGGRGGDREEIGFVTCRMGTGYDEDWLVTGEKYVYGPGETVVLGGQYEYVYGSRWYGRGWYQPDGGTYYENVWAGEIADPGDYGYEYWTWYNIVYYYDPMNDSMQEQEGLWTATWYDEGEAVCSRDFTVMYELADHALCADVSEGLPVSPGTVYQPEDAYCYCWAQLDNFAMIQPDDFTWKWYGPEGLYQTATADLADPDPGTWYGWIRCWHGLEIAGRYPASHPGLWRVEFFVRDIHGVEDLKFTEYFTIGLSGDPDIAIAPLSLVLDYRDKAIEPRCGPDDAHDTSGPEPFPGIERGLRIAGGTLLDLPSYLWYRGCGPTALGMLLGYWDAHGYPDLVAGDAGSQTAAVAAMISSDGNWNDYCLPMDDTGPLLPDLSELPYGDEHADDCVADHMNTSQSYHDNRYGWSWFNHVGPAFTGYVNQVDVSYEPSYNERTYASLSWDDFKAEIDAGRPLIFLVDTNADGYTDHFVTAMGYDEFSGSYACHDTWDNDVHWFEYAAMAPGQSWGVYGAILCRLGNSASFIIENVGGAQLDVTDIHADGVSPWLTGSWPAAPFSLAPGEERAITVRVDPDLAGAGLSTERLIVESNDPDESPYPGGVDVSVIKDGGPSCLITPQQLDFHVTDPHSSETDAASFVVSNGGPGQLQVDAILVTSDDPDAEPDSWSFVPETFTLDAGQGMEVAVTWDPVAYGDAHTVWFDLGLGCYPIEVEANCSTPVQISLFELEALPGAVEAAWEAEPGAEFRLSASSAGGSWTVPHRYDASSGRFRARDESEALLAGGRFRYLLEGRDEGGGWEALRSGSVELQPLSARDGLAGAFPNPFNPTATVVFHLAQEERLRLRVLDLSGREVALLAEGVHAPGRHELIWRGRDGAGRELPSGVYFLELARSGRTQSEKLVLLR